MPSDKLIFCMGEGIGNVIQTMPAIRTIKEVLGYGVDFWHAFGYYSMPKLIPHVDKWFVGNKITALKPDEYVGKVSTWSTKDRINIGPLSKLILYASISDISMNRSEVDVYMDIARVLGADDDDLLWHSGCLYKQVEEEYDVVMHDGYNRRGAAFWKHKSYPHYEEVVKQLGNLKICSIGGKEEYIKGTDDKTGLPLYDTLGIITNSKLFIGNDSGMYHCANALGVNNIVIFTYTSQIKNYDKRFHKFAKILCREDLDSLSCQNTPRRKTCKTKECRDIDPKVVVNKI